MGSNQRVKIGKEDHVQHDESLRYANADGAPREICLEVEIHCYCFKFLTTMNSESGLLARGDHADNGSA
jgi:hypothetical protein